MDKQQLERLFYISDTSASGLRWRVAVGKRIKVGDVAGTLNPVGYWKVGWGGAKFYVHRVVSVLAGTLNSLSAALIVDHIDGDRSNNVPANLRPVTYRQNGNNHSTHRAGRLAGAYLFRGLWQSQIRVAGTLHYIGRFKTEQQAHAAYMLYRHTHNLD